MKTALLLLALAAPASSDDCRALERTRALLERAALSTVSVDALLARCAPRRSRAPVELFGHTDHCTGQPAALIGPRSSCEALSVGAPRKSWSVRVHGRCIDTEDLPFLEACRRFRRPGPVRIFHSDFCRGRLVATTGPRADCSALPDVGTAAWGVERDGRCVNIPDMSPRAACERYRYGG